MGTPRFTPEFKEEAVRQITERGYSVAEVSDRLDVSAHSLYKWLRAIKPDNSEQHARDLLEAKSVILKLRAQLKRTKDLSVGSSQKRSDRKPKNTIFLLPDQTFSQSVLWAGVCIVDHFGLHH